MYKQKNNFFILTGSPGPGKSTLINELRRRSFTCHNEVTRQVLSEQLAIDGPGLPAKNPLLFIEMMQNLAIRNFEESYSEERPVFFDRAIPDLISYALRFNVAPKEFEESARQYRYNTIVFLLSPWKEIFVNDEVRKLSYEMSVAVHQGLVSIYTDLGYTLIEVPKVQVSERADFVLNSIAALVET